MVAFEHNAHAAGSEFLYAQHGRELVGCKSPVRKRDSLRRQYAKCFFMSEVQGEGNCGRVIDRGKEACECAA
jgi:hypothetical protein